MPGHRANSPGFQPPDTPSDAVKFELFVKKRQVDQVATSLEQLMLLSESERLRWFSDSADHVAELLNSFVDDSMLALDGANLDQEALDLSLDLLNRLREVMMAINHILYDDHQLSS
ncbi:MAG: hypothetical protein COU69_03510 [Candidatus Pacebacteria bacterium CG10_big_fil_rev_8_21_14_0_10_56_10]|nr:MAG: hypothetical protein COU69_03510 [Candidatus Pacebacteria bacterium CG10_big_fil_rev_8_21_14_0_10_56_10]